MPSRSHATKDALHLKLGRFFADHLTNDRTIGIHIDQGIKIVRSDYPTLNRAWARRELNDNYGLYIKIQKSVVYLIDDPNVDIADFQREVAFRESNTKERKSGGRPEGGL